MDRRCRAAVGAVLSSCLFVACGSSEPPTSIDTPQAPLVGSLYNGPEPRPGPPILYAPPPRAPQLENTGVWRAPPILISGASAYRDGEFLYQDFLFDDHGANGTLENVVDIAAGLDGVADDVFSRRGGSYRYPLDPVYANNAADLVEFRVRALDEATAFRVTLNTLLDPDRVGLTLALGDSAEPRVLPRGANVVVPARWALTVFEAQAELVDLDTGEVLASDLPVDVDLERAQIQWRVPRSVRDPGRERIAMAFGVGLWDTTADAYLLPGAVASETSPGGALGLSGPPAAFFNVAFRYDEPGTELLPSLFTDLVLNTAWWRNQRQGAALAAGDISEFRAMVDFGRLRDGVRDDMPNQPGGTPTVGAISRIFASRFTHAPGIDPANDCGTAQGCLGRFGGQLQPYALYVPDREAPDGGFGFTLLLHSLAANYHQYHGTRHQRQLGERGRGYLVATPAGRGPDGWYVETAGADAFEVWNDVARHYPLNPNYAAASGVSMGGYGSYRFATRYPDLFARVHTIVGPPAVGIWVPPLQPSPGPQSNTFEALASLRHVPTLIWAATTDELVPYPGPLTQAQELDRLGYRYRFESYAPAEHLTFSFNDEYQPGADFLGDHAVVRNPAHISYVVNPRMDFANVGMVADHVYWLSALATRDGEPGSIDAVSEGFGASDAEVLPTQFGAGLLTGGNLPAIAYLSQSRDWGDAPAATAADRLRLVLRNIASLTVHPERARLSCAAELQVDSDGPVEVRFAGCDRVERY
ncbi:alpha/beta hydrolase-fold protein [Sinimarinibacterium thermocellulolyticum]|uniref:Alpha/beta hydrolase-fold protein n=1 Tax=Sinimarinibacterium thermocellulolyticum TaxID=3170016 RepID=A0ABV2AA76_9GAMM